MIIDILLQYLLHEAEKNFLLLQNNNFESSFLENILFDLKENEAMVYQYCIYSIQYILQS